jgi:diguanylate cyclase (GGDEF)-like protein
MPKTRPTLKLHPLFADRTHNGANCLSVLVLQGNGAERDHLISSLETHGFQPVRTVSAVSGLADALADREGLSAILVDLALDDDLTACQQIRETDPTIPLLVIFDEISAEHLQEALAVGASGCVPEPLNPLELAAKLRAAIRQNRFVLHTEAEEIQSSSDPLTHLANDRCFHRNLDRAWRRDWRSRAPISLIVLNIDYLSGFNLLYGRCAGDECLRGIAATIQSALYRPDDLAAHRKCGEFAVLFSGTDHAGALVVVERLRSRVMDLAIPHGASSVGPNVTISLGVATAIPGSDQALDNLVATAERALSQAKLRGRNQFVALEEERVGWPELRRWRLRGRRRLAVHRNRLH